MARSKTLKMGAKAWMDRINRALKVKDSWSEKFRVPACYAAWEGAVPDNRAQGEWININMIYSVLRAELPALYSTDPYYYVKLKKSYSPDPADIPLFEARGKIRQAMLNYLKGELDLKTKARLAIFDAMFQFGALKVQYSADLVENPDYGKPIYDEEGDPIPNKSGDTLMEPEFLPANEAYKILRVHPNDLLVDEDAGPINDDVRWIAQRIKRPLAEVKADKRFRKSARDRLQPTEISDPSEQERLQRKKGGNIQASDKKEADVAVLWEIYDRIEKETCVIAEGCDEYLTDPGPLPPGVESDPYVTLRFVLRDDSWYPLPPVSQLIDSQYEYCDVRSKLQTHRKRFNRKYTLDMTAFDDPETEAGKLIVGDDGTVLMQSRPVGYAPINPISDAPLDQQVHTELAYLRRDFDDLAIGPNQRGSATGVDSATEAGILEKRAMVREGDNQGLVMDFLSATARKLDQIVEANITRDQAVRVSGPQGEGWEMIRSDDYTSIAGEYEYSVDVGSVTPQYPEIERAQWMAFLALLGNAPQLGLSPALVKRMAEMHHIYDEKMVQEIISIMQKIMSGQLQPPGAGGQQGSAPGVPLQLPGAAGMGAAFGPANMRGGQAGLA